MRAALVIGFLFTGCAHAPSAYETRCRPLVAEILAVQEERDRLADEMSNATQSFESGDITCQQHEYDFQSWLASEQRLRQHVTYLYNRAYASACL